MMNHILKIAICQMPINADKRMNLRKAESMIKAAAAENCQLAILPEMFNCPYKAELFSQYAEVYPEGESIQMLAKAAAEANIGVVGGSIPERDERGKLYNTSFIFDEKGVLVGRHRKVHLFDVEIEGGTVFKESSILAAGQKSTIVKIAGVTLGIGICYDIRFPELSRLMALAGADVIVFPAVFSVSTGPDHWELLMRARAVDNQVFVVGAAPANTLESACLAHGHSMVVDPWGNMIGVAGVEERMLIVEMNLSKMYAVREQLPLLKHRRPDVYENYHKL